MSGRGVDGAYDDDSMKGKDATGRIDSMTRIIPITLGYVSAFLIKGEKSVLIDTGRPGDARRIMDKISSTGIDPKNLSLILLTHCHHDHCGSVSELKKLTGAKVAIHRLNADGLVYGTNEEIRPHGLRGSSPTCSSIYSNPIAPLTARFLTSSSTTS